MDKLDPSIICLVMHSPDTIVHLDAGTAAWGIATGRTYGQGRIRLEDGDQKSGVLLYWPQFLVRATLAFLDRVPTADHVYNAEADIRFKVHNPAWLYQYLLKGDHRLSVAALADRLSRDLAHILAEMARTTSPDALLPGPGADAVQQLQAELNRLYYHYGLEAQNICLRRVGRAIAEIELQQLVTKIENEARIRQISLDKAYQQQVTRLKADGLAGDQKAQTLADQLVGVQSFDQLIQLTRQTAIAQRESVTLQEQTVMLLGEILHHVRLHSAFAAQGAAALSGAGQSYTDHCELARLAAEIEHQRLGHLVEALRALEIAQPADGITQ